MMPEPREYVTVTWPLVGDAPIDDRCMTLRLPYPMTAEQWARFLQYIDLLKDPMMWPLRQDAAGVVTTRT